MTRTDIVAAARQWLGTPYCHRASLRGAGADCIGLVRGIWRELVGPELIELPRYTPDWREGPDEETLFAGLAACLDLRALSDAAAGDVLAFRMIHGAPMKHCAILTDTQTLIHAYWGHGVCENAFVPWWRKRAAAAFSFPGLET